MIELKMKFDFKDLGIFRKDKFRFSTEIDNAIKKAATDIRNTAVTNISTGMRTGRIYRRRTIQHQASAPGEYPKTDTGRLVNSIRTDFRFMEADIGSDVNYSQYLETGTSKMKARPWLQPSMDANQEKWLGYVNTALKRSFGL